jgi:hypothetical protein
MTSGAPLPFEDRVQYAGETKEEACAAFLAYEREHGRGSATGNDRLSCE